MIIFVWTTFYLFLLVLECIASCLVDCSFYRGRQALRRYLETGIAGYYGIYYLSKSTT